MQAFPHGVEALREHPGTADDGHEVVVTVPAWDDVGVQVGGDARACGVADVEADVEAVGLEGTGENVFPADNGVHEVGTLAGGEVGEAGNFAVGDDEEVPGVVGEFVQQDRTMGAAAKDEGGAVVVRLEEAGKGILPPSLWLGGFNIGHAPVCVQELHQVF